MESADIIDQMRKLAELVAQMRKLGVIECALADGTHVKLGAEPTQTTVAISLDAPDLDAAAVAEKAREKAHYAYWRKVTASSGTPIPDYRPRG